MSGEIHPETIRQLVTRTFQELGVGDQDLLHMSDTILVREGFYCGRSSRSTVRKARCCGPFCWLPSLKYKTKRPEHATAAHVLLSSVFMSSVCCWRQPTTGEGRPIAVCAIFGARTGSRIRRNSDAWVEFWRIRLRAPRRCRTIAASLISSAPLAAVEWRLLRSTHDERRQSYVDRVCQR
jgi:hypothetical protein